MDILKLIVRNSWRHPLRTILTALGIAIALLAFCLIRTMIDAWYSGVNASAKNRLVVRNSVSLVFYLPVAYEASIRQIPGVSKVGRANWFGGKYRDENARFAQFAINSEYLDVYPEYIVSSEERAGFESDKQGAIVGQDLAERYGFKIGDVLQLRGGVFPGLWQFNVRGIFRGRDEGTLTRTMFFHWDYLNDRNKAEIGRQPDHVGVYVIEIATGADPATVSKEVDLRFANSFAETLTESETAFAQSFVSMSSTIIGALDAVSIVVIVIMLLVLANTMLMSARERYREYSILKSLGFTAPKLSLLIFGESLFLTLMGFVLLCALLFPIFTFLKKGIFKELATFFPVFSLHWETLCIAFASALLVALVAGIAPVRAIARLKVTEGLRKLG